MMGWLAWAAVFAVLTGLHGLAVDPIPTGTGQDGAPALSLAELSQLRQLPNPKVVALEPSATGNRPEYEVWGKTIQLWSRPRDIRQRGSHPGTVPSSTVAEHPAVRSTTCINSLRLIVRSQSPSSLG